MNINEEKNRIKQIMGLTLESENKELTTIKSTINNLTDVNKVNEYLGQLNDKHASDSSKLVLIFPGRGQYSVVATAIYLFNINAHVFTNIGDCINKINELSNKGKKYSEIYIGSHGGGREGLIYSIDDGNESTVLKGLSNALSKITIPNVTKILFSACNAADNYGKFMKKVAEDTGSYVYASEGAFDWMMNKSQGRLWVCPPEPKTSDRFMTREYNHCKVVTSTPFNFIN